jgi:hypothetical protein
MDAATVLGGVKGARAVLGGGAALDPRLHAWGLALIDGAETRDRPAGE